MIWRKLWWSNQRIQSNDRIDETRAERDFNTIERSGRRWTWVIDSDDLKIAVSEETLLIYRKEVT